MRTDAEMYSLILGYAEADEGIRAVILNGSRTNPNVPKDKLRDFDVVYLVRDTEPYTVNLDWLNHFGDKLVWQLPDKRGYYDDAYEGAYGILMQFKDGNRIDLTIANMKDYYGYCFDDRLSRVLLDKDGIIPKLPESDESSHYITEPTQLKFTACRCEFWWVSTYVAKGLWRNQPLFAEEHMSLCVRKELKKMLTWYAGTLNGFSIAVGKCGDRLASLVPREMWEKFLDTYSSAEIESLWKALRTATELFSELSHAVGEHFGFDFVDMDDKPDTWDDDVPRYLFSEREI